MNIFDINFIAFEWQGYSMSWLELFGTLFGFWAVWLSGREKISSWLIGIVNVILFLILFYQMQLYSDMILQIFFFVTNIYGYITWSKKNDTQKYDLPISHISKYQGIIYIIILLLGSFFGGKFIAQLPQLLPSIFKLPTSFPYADTFVLIGSIIAQLLLTRKKIENWLLWIIVDIVACIIYFQKGAILLTIEFFVFIIIAFIGYINWLKKLNSKTYQFSSKLNN